jgi:hypothetical protein
VCVCVHFLQSTYLFINQPIYQSDQCILASYLSIYQSINLSIYSPFLRSLLIYLHTFVNIYIYNIYIYIYLYIYLSMTVCLSINLSIFLCALNSSVCVYQLSINQQSINQSFTNVLSIYLSINESIHLSIYLSVNLSINYLSSSSSFHYPILLSFS